MSTNEGQIQYEFLTTIQSNRLIKLDFFFHKVEYFDERKTCPIRELSSCLFMVEIVYKNLSNKINIYEVMQNSTALAKKLKYGSFQRHFLTQKNENKLAKLQTSKKFNPNLLPLDNVLQDFLLCLHKTK